MVKYWVILSTDWKLEDVQAALNVIISLLCVIAVFTSARYFWHSSARRISQNDQVPISSLLSFTTLGEALDVIILLKSRLFHTAHARLALQCLFVVIFSVSAIFAGPISRFSTRVGQTTGERPVKGLLACKSYSCDIDNFNRWHDIFSALDKASFPHNQLPDFRPDLDQDYAYRSVDWNSTFSARCQSTGQTKIKLNATGNYTSGDYWLYDEIPALYDILSDRFQQNLSTLWTSFSGTKIPDQKIWSSLAMFQYAELRPDDDWYKSDPTERISISIAAIAMKDAPLFQMTVLDDWDYSFGVGDIPDAWYTKVECDLTRSRPITDNNQWEANVDISKTCDVSRQMTTFFTPSTLRPQADKTTQIELPSSDDLFRFYQSWNLAKDTHWPTHAIRDLHMRLKTVELSIIFIAVVSLITLIVLIGFIHCLIAHFRYGGVYSRIPETKVDWLLQSLREAEGKDFSTVMPHDQEASEDEANGNEYNHNSYLKSRGVSSTVTPCDNDGKEELYDYNDTSIHEKSNINRTRTRPYHEPPKTMPWEQARYILLPHPSSNDRDTDSSNPNVFSSNNNDGVKTTRGWGASKCHIDLSSHTFQLPQPQLMESCTHHIRTLTRGVISKGRSRNGLPPFSVPDRDDSDLVDY